MKHAYRKTPITGLRARQGFTLSELLITVVLVGLITLAVAGGIGMVSRSYSRVVDRADAETLLATTLNKMQDELCFARVDLETPANAEGFSFISGVSGLRIRFRKDSETSAAMMDFMQGDASSTTVNQTYQFTDDKLISDNRMYVTYSSCKPDYTGGKFNGRFLIEGLSVISLKDGHTLAKLPDGANKYYVAAINYRAESATP